MASEVDICNLALAHLGDDASIISIDPPEGSAQAAHCAQMYPIARDFILDSNRWSFCTRRIQLAELTNTNTAWLYAYAVPDDALDVFSIVPNDATDDYGSTTSDNWGSQVSQAYTPQPYTLESDDSGNTVIYTNQQNAVARYIIRVTETGKFPPTLVVAISWQLASFLAGVVVKGDAGAAMGLRCQQFADKFTAQAKQSDAQQQRLSVQQVVPWMAVR